MIIVKRSICEDLNIVKMIIVRYERLEIFRVHYLEQRQNIFTIVRLVKKLQCEFVILLVLRVLDHWQKKDWYGLT